MSERETFTFDGWAIIEFMGHRKRAGKVKTAEIGGTAVFVVESPTDEETVSEVYAASGLYCLTPVSEDVARIAARSINPRQLTAWSLPPSWRKAIHESEEREFAIDASVREDDRDDVDFDEVGF